MFVEMFTDMDMDRDTGKDTDKDENKQMVRQQVGIDLPRAKHHLSKAFKADFSRKFCFTTRVLMSGTRAQSGHWKDASWREVVNCLLPT